MYPAEQSSARDECARHERDGVRAEEPRPVIRGETIGTPRKAAHVDWLSFSVVPSAEFRGNPLDWIAPPLEKIFRIERSTWRFTGRGWTGYDQRVDLGDYGLLAYGGERQRDTLHVSLNAHGCALVKDWDATGEWGEASGARISRVDLAHDDFEGRYVSIDQALNWHREGGFNAGGRPAKPHLRDDLDSGEGKTFYVGKRVNGKLCRIYEKGKQLRDPTSNWCRIEVELRNKCRVIPWDVLSNPGGYLAGAYPCFSYLSGEQCKLKTIRRESELTYAQMKRWLWTAAGPALNVMCQVLEGDAGAVLTEVVREGRPKRLRGLPLDHLREAKA